MDVKQLAKKLGAMMGVESNVLVDQINRCFFAEAMDDEEGGVCDDDCDPGDRPDSDRWTLN